MAGTRKLKGQIEEPKFKGLSGRLDMDSPATATAFRLAAEAYTKKATKTRAAALETLQREGILTKSGKLTKRYS